MLIVALPYLVAPVDVLALFLDRGAAANADVLRLATGLLTIAALLQIFDCAQNIGVGILRGLGDVKSAFRISIVGYWMIGLPVAWSAGVSLGYGIHGIWSGLAVGLAATAAMLLRKFEARLGILTKRTSGAPS